VPEAVPRVTPPPPAPVAVPVPVSPKDRFITVYGRNPVLEVLADRSLEVDKVILADTARGAGADEIVAAAARRGVPLQRAGAERVKKLAGNGRQDQGVLADVVAPRMRPLAQALADAPLSRVVLLDGVTTPANVGMVIRSATAAGVDGIVVPRRGVASGRPARRQGLGGRRLPGPDPQGRHRPRGSDHVA